jgi:hypothetical protein
MAEKDRLRWIMQRAGFVAVRAWLTRQQAAQVKAWSEENREAAQAERKTHKDT